jgi:hypothetical protein
MTNGAQGPGGTLNLNVAADETKIYEEGNLFIARITDLTGNEVAIRQLITNYNVIAARNKSMATELRKAEKRLASYALQPTLAIALGIVNVAAVIIVGISVNYLSSTSPPKASWPLLACGGVLTLVVSIGNIAVPYVIDYVKGKYDANER